MSTRKDDEREKNSKGIINYLIKWKGWPAEYKEWVAEEDMAGAPDSLREIQKAC
jgi:hypothetical protein